MQLTLSWKSTLALEHWKLEGQRNDFSLFTVEVDGEHEHIKNSFTFGSKPLVVFTLPTELARILSSFIKKYKVKTIVLKI